MSINRYDFSTGFILTNNRWHLIAVTWSGRSGLVRAYHNGTGDFASAKAAQLHGTIGGTRSVWAQLNQDRGG